MVALHMDFDDSLKIRRERTASALVLLAPIVGLFVSSHIAAMIRRVEAQRTFE